jgi:hypothetical protein
MEIGLDGPARERGGERRWREKGRMTGGSQGVVVGIENEYRVSTGARKLDIEERILLTRTKYSF